MTQEKFIVGPELSPDRMALNKAIEEFPYSTLLPLVAHLPTEAFAVLSHEHKMGTFAFRDFAFYEALVDGSAVAKLLLELANEVDAEKQKNLVKDIVGQLSVDRLHFV